MLYMLLLASLFFYLSFLFCFLLISEAPSFLFLFLSLSSFVLSPSGSRSAVSAPAAPTPTWQPDMRRVARMMVSPITTDLSLARADECNNDDEDMLRYARAWKSIWREDAPRDPSLFHAMMNDWLDLFVL